MLKNFRLSFALATLTLVSSLGVASKASADTATVTIAEDVPATCLFNDATNTPGTLGYNIANKTLNTASGTGSPTTGSISVLCNAAGSISITSVTPTIPNTMTQSSLTATISDGTSTATHNGTTSSGTIALASGTEDITVGLNVQYNEVLAPGNYSYAIELTANP
jgi:hypothetical protein